MDNDNGQPLWKSVFLPYFGRGFLEIKSFRQQETRYIDLLDLLDFLLDIIDI